MILQQSENYPDCPYVIVTAPLCTTACNIKGQTLNSAFRFTFGKIIPWVIRSVIIENTFGKPKATHSGLTFDDKSRYAVYKIDL